MLCLFQKLNNLHKEQVSKDSVIDSENICNCSSSSSPPPPLTLPISSCASTAVTTAAAYIIIQCILLPNNFIKDTKARIIFVFIIFVLEFVIDIILIISNIINKKNRDNMVMTIKWTLTFNTFLYQ